MGQEHTKEPWFADLRGGCCAIYPKSRFDDTPGCHGDDERNIAYSMKGAHMIDEPERFGWEMDEQTQANFSRIVACVNACAGLSNEALEAGVIGDMVEALRDLESFRNDTKTAGIADISREMRIWEQILQVTSKLNIKE